VSDVTGDLSLPNCNSSQAIRYGNPLATFYDVNKKSRIVIFLIIPSSQNNTNTHACNTRTHTRIRIKNKNTLFSLGTLTYTYERQDMIQIALKRLPGGRGVP
jgi:hypothetical protein